MPGSCLVIGEGPAIDRDSCFKRNLCLISEYETGGLHGIYHRALGNGGNDLIRPFPFECYTAFINDAAHTVDNAITEYPFSCICQVEEVSGSGKGLFHFEQGFSVP